MYARWLEWNTAQVMVKKIMSMLVLSHAMHERIQNSKMGTALCYKEKTEVVCTTH